jgi:nucleotide-binding universal stress UspA family protein
MVQEILVCLEGSRSGSSAVDVAVRLGQQLDAVLVGLAIVDEPEIVAAEAIPIGGAAFKQQRDQVILDEARERAKQWIDDFTLRCRTAEVLGVGIEVNGRPASAIVREARRRDLTVLGRHANFRFATEERDGRTREAVLRGTGKPVLLVPEDPVDGAAVLVAYDGTLAVERAMRSFGDSGLARGRDVHVLTVGDEGTRAWETAQRGCALFAEIGITATAHHVVSLQTVTEAILTHRDKLGAGVIVQGAYAHSRFSRLLWGSVTKEMSERTVVPVYFHD